MYPDEGIDFLFSHVQFDFSVSAFAPTYTNKIKENEIS